MKTTRGRLKQIIKEELEVVLTNDEAIELFGEEIMQELLNEQDPAITDTPDPEAQVPAGTEKTGSKLVQRGTEIGQQLRPEELIDQLRKVMMHRKVTPTIRLKAFKELFDEVVPGAGVKLTKAVEQELATKAKKPQG